MAESESADGEDLESALVAIWSIAEDCGGSRAEMQRCLDDIQNEVVSVVPDADEQATESDDIEEDEVEDVGEVDEV